MNSSGTTPLSFDFGFSLGGEGFAVYSVRENEFRLGVRGRELPFVSPLTLTPFSMLGMGAIGVQLPQELWLRRDVTMISSSVVLCCVFK